MGFLKTLFEKKAKKKDLEPGVVGRAKSEFFPAKLRQESETSSGTSKHKENDDSPLHIDRLNLGGAKSFSHGQTRPPRGAAVEDPATHSQGVKPSVKYHDINQFSQKVELYRGSVSTVYKAVCNESSTKVIIKAYRKAKMQPKHFHKLDREIVIMKLLSGAYVTEFYDNFEDDQHVYIVMEYCEGGDLFKTMLMNGGLLDEHWVCVEIICPILRILEKMHTMKIMHRDIKPENIFLTRNGKFKLGDYGLAIIYDEEIPFSRSGTLDYMAPEVLRNPHTQLQEGKSVDMATLDAKGVKPYTSAVDIWAAGVLAYELVCGRPPFEVDDEAQTAALIMYSDNIKFPTNHSPQWADFVRASLIKKPEQRPSATVLLAHPWIRIHMQQSLSENGNRRTTKEELMAPLPLPSTFTDVQSPVRGPDHMHVRKSKSMSVPTKAAPAPVQPEAKDAHEDHHEHKTGSRLAAATNASTVAAEHHHDTSYNQNAEELEVEGSQNSDTATKPGMKERMKSYFQRQAGL